MCETFFISKKRVKKARQKGIFTDNGTFLVFIPFFLEKKGNKEEKIGTLNDKIHEVWVKNWEILDKLREV